MNVVAIKDNVSPVTKWNPRKDAADREIMNRPGFAGGSFS